MGDVTNDTISEILLLPSFCSSAPQDGKCQNALLQVDGIDAEFNITTTFEVLK
jgi:hypothetical protein